MRPGSRAYQNLGHGQQVREALAQLTKCIEGSAGWSLARANSAGQGLSMAGGAHKGYRRSGVVFRLESCEHYLPGTLRLLAGNRLEM